jgi:hypothetical protein
LGNSSAGAFVQPIVHCHLRFGVVLVADGWYLIVYIPLALLLTVIRSYRGGYPTTEDTHQVSVLSHGLRLCNLYLEASN